MSSGNFSVTSVILAGGLATRMGGNKGLQVLQGRPLVSWVLEAVRQHSAEVLINVNQAQHEYANFGCRLVADLRPDWPGPLAGLESGLVSAHTEYVLTAPCDTPYLPHDLVTRLSEELRRTSAEAAVVVTGGHRQPALALYKKNVLPKLLDYLGSGRRKVNDWLNTLQLCEVVFDNAEDFENINSRVELAHANQRHRNSRKDIS